MPIKIVHVTFFLYRFFFLEFFPGLFMLFLQWELYLVFERQVYTKMLSTHKELAEA